jgi:hypothetical protein
MENEVRKKRTERNAMHMVIDHNKPIQMTPKKIGGSRRWSMYHANNYLQSKQIINFNLKSIEHENNKIKKNKTKINTLN